MTRMREPEREAEGRCVEVPGLNFVDVLARQQSNRGDETEESGDGKGQREMGDEDERGHDDGHRHDQPKRQPSASCRARGRRA